MTDQRLAMTVGEAEVGQRLDAEKHCLALRTIGRNLSHTSIIPQSYVYEQRMTSDRTL